MLYFFEWVLPRALLMYSDQSSFISTYLPLRPHFLPCLQINKLSLCTYLEVVTDLGTFIANRDIFSKNIFSGK